MFDVNGQVFSKYNVSFNAANVGDLIDQRDQTYPNPPIAALVELGQLVQREFAPAVCANYIRQVFTWGGGSRNLDRFLENGQETISVILRNASCLVLNANHSNNSALSVGQAIYSITTLRHIQMSFASKLLRFLHPEHVVIFDSKIRNALGYADNAEGYANFHTDCVMIKDHPSVAGVVQVYGRDCNISDIEAAIFMSIP